MTAAVTTGVVVTGGASGIGRASAAMLAEAGRPVAIWDLDADQAAQVAARIAGQYGVAAVGLGVDVRDAAAIRDAAAESRKALPSIGGLVHAAGVVLQTGLGGVTEENWALVLDVNLRAQVLIAQALLEDLRAHPGSAIVGIASINATLGNGLIPAYSASKGGLARPHAVDVRRAVRPWYPCQRGIARADPHADDRPGGRAAAGRYFRAAYPSWASR